MKQLFVLDPIEFINPNKDSSAALMQAAERASIEVWICTPSDLQARGNKAWVAGRIVKVQVAAAASAPVPSLFRKAVRCATRFVVQPRLFCHGF